MYFDMNNNYFDDYLYNDNNININNINFYRNNELFSIEEGFNKGNIFKNIYSKYKNHVYKLKTTNQKDESLYKLQMYAFTLKDLNLYLDLHPTDQSVIDKYLQVKKLYEEEKKKYNGLISSIDTTNSDEWTWINNPWPWDKGGN